MALHGEVRSVEQLTPSLVRVVLGVPDLPGSSCRLDRCLCQRCDPPADAPYGPVSNRARCATPTSDTSGLLAVATPSAAGIGIAGAVDRLRRAGRRGVAGPWAGWVRPGDVLVFEGPGSGYRPDPEADWHLPSAMSPRCRRSRHHWRRCRPAPSPWSGSSATVRSMRSRFAPRARWTWRGCIGRAGRATPICCRRPYEAWSSFEVACTRSRR